MTFPLFQDTTHKLEHQIQQHSKQLARERAKLQKLSEGLDEINSTYDAVYQCIGQRENRILEQVRNHCFYGEIAYLPFGIFLFPIEFIKSEKIVILLNLSNVQSKRPLLVDKILGLASYYCI